MSTSGSSNALCWGFKGVEGMATYNVTLIEDRKLYDLSDVWLLMIYTMALIGTGTLVLWDLGHPFLFRSLGVM